MTSEIDPSCDCGSNKWHVYYIEMGDWKLITGQTYNGSGWIRKCQDCGEIQKEQHDNTHTT